MAGLWDRQTGERRAGYGGSSRRPGLRQRQIR